MNQILWLQHLVQNRPTKRGSWCPDKPSLGRLTVEEAALSSEGTAGPSVEELGGRKILGGD